MKQNQLKSFTFKVAKKSENKTQWKAREGVAIAGCSLVPTPFGPEPRTQGWRPHPAQDNGDWC